MSCLRQGKAKLNNQRSPDVASRQALNTEHGVSSENHGLTRLSDENLSQIINYVSNKKHRLAYIGEVKAALESKGVHINGAEHLLISRIEAFQKENPTAKVLVITDQHLLKAYESAYKKVRGLPSLEDINNQLKTVGIAIGRDALGRLVNCLNNSSAEEIIKIRKPLKEKDLEDAYTILVKRLKAKVHRLPTSGDLAKYFTKKGIKFSAARISELVSQFNKVRTLRGDKPFELCTTPNIIPDALICRVDKFLKKQNKRNATIAEFTERVNKLRRPPATESGVASAIKRLNKKLPAEKKITLINREHKSGIYNNDVVDTYANYKERHNKKPTEKELLTHLLERHPEAKLSEKYFSKLLARVRREGRDISLRGVERLDKVTLESAFTNLKTNLGRNPLARELTIYLNKLHPELNLKEGSVAKAILILSKDKYKKGEQSDWRSGGVKLTLAFDKLWNTYCDMLRTESQEGNYVSITPLAKKLGCHENHLRNRVKILNTGLVSRGRMPLLLQGSLETRDLKILSAYSSVLSREPAVADNKTLVLMAYALKFKPDNLREGVLRLSKRGMQAGLPALPIPLGKLGKAQLDRPEILNTIRRYQLWCLGRATSNDRIWLKLDIKFNFYFEPFKISPLTLLRSDADWRLSSKHEFLFRLNKGKSQRNLWIDQIQSKELSAFDKLKLYADPNYIMPKVVETKLVPKISKIDANVAERETESGVKLGDEKVKNQLSEKDTEEILKRIIAELRSDIETCGQSYQVVDYSKLLAIKETMKRVINSDVLGYETEIDTLADLLSKMPEDHIAVLAFLGDHVSISGDDSRIEVMRYRYETGMFTSPSTHPYDRRTVEDHIRAF